MAAAAGGPLSAILGVLTQLIGEFTNRALTVSANDNEVVELIGRLRVVLAIVSSVSGQLNGPLATAAIERVSTIVDQAKKLYQDYFAANIASEFIMTNATRDGLRQINHNLTGAQVDLLIVITANAAPAAPPPAISSPPPPPTDPSPILCSAARVGREDLLRTGLAAREPVDGQDQHGQTPLFVAAANGNYSVLEKLLEKGADPTLAARGDVTPLHAASKHPRQAVAARLLVDPRVRNAVNAQTAELRYTALHFACESGLTSIVANLLAVGADTRIVSATGATPLHLAAANNHVEIIELLATRDDFNLDCVDIDGATPLLHAVRKGALKAVRAVVRLGAKVNVPDINSATPLHIAADMGNEKLARILLDAGAELEATTVDNETALQCAAKKGHIAVVLLLLERRARLDVRTASMIGISPFPELTNFCVGQTIWMYPLPATRTPQHSFSHRFVSSYSQFIGRQ